MEVRVAAFYGPPAVIGAFLLFRWLADRTTPGRLALGVFGGIVLVTSVIAFYLRRQNWVRTGTSAPDQARLGWKGYQSAWRWFTPLGLVLTVVSAVLPPAGDGVRTAEAVAYWTGLALLVLGLPITLRGFFWTRRDDSQGRRGRPSQVP